MGRRESGGGGGAKKQRTAAALTKMPASQQDQDENSLVGNEEAKVGYSGSELPEDIWCYTHSLMPMRDAARVACVSRAFLRSWRRRPSLDFSHESLGLVSRGPLQMVREADFNSRVESVLRNRSCIGLKAFRLEIPITVFPQERYRFDRLDSWLQVALQPGIEELKLRLGLNRNYKFPCWLLSDDGGRRAGRQLRCLFLAGCRFRPTAALNGCLRSLTRLQLISVKIRTGELGCLLSASLVSLERLELRNCSIRRLEIPCLQRLDYLEVVNCSRLRAIESKAPNLSSVFAAGDFKVPLSLENEGRIKTLKRHCTNGVFYACNDLPFIMPNLESLTICSYGECVDTPMVLMGKFLRLKSEYCCWWTDL